MTDILTCQEFSHFLAYGDPLTNDDISGTNVHTDNDSQLVQLEWISTLESTTFEGLTFGYSVAPYLSTVVH